MIPGNQINNDPTRSIVDAQTPLIEAVNAFDEVGTYAATTNDLNDLADHERQGSFQGCNHLLPVLILHNKAERNMGPNFGTSSRGRQWTMSYQIQDDTSQGLLQIFNQVMYATALCDQPIFFGNDFDMSCRNVCTILLPSMLK